MKVTAWPDVPVSYTSPVNSIQSIREATVPQITTHTDT